MADSNVPPVPPPPAPISNGSSDDLGAMMQRLISQQQSGGYQFNNGGGQQRDYVRSQTRVLKGDRRPLTLRVGQFVEGLLDKGNYKLHFITAYHEHKLLPDSEPLDSVVRKYGITKEAAQSGRQIFHIFKFSAPDLSVEGGGQLQVGKIYFLVGSELPGNVRSERNQDIQYVDYASLRIYPEDQKARCLDLLYKPG